MESEDIELFEMVQEYLKPCPLIICGSGATIPFGMPSMNDLKDELKIKEEGNLEEILSNIDDQSKKGEYEKQIFSIVNKADYEFRIKLSGDRLVAQHLERLFNFFYATYPQVNNVITTNYDCVLEYILSKRDLPFSDGFTGKAFSCFSKSRFKTTKQHINLYKVHGSLRWYQDCYSYDNKMMDAIFPTSEKYRLASIEPFRTLIHKSDNAIEGAKCFLAIGFGFNDEHLTPKIEKAIQNNKGIVVIAKTATESCKNKLENSSKYMLIEAENETNTTKFSFKKGEKRGTKTLSGNYWEIKEFNKIIGAN